MLRWLRACLLSSDNDILCRLSREVSRTLQAYCVYLWYIQSRVLLATIKNLGWNLCPQCLILKTDIHGVGMAADAQHRKKIRVDNVSRRQDVEKARKAMFEKGCKITSTQVQSSLAAHSMVPTHVTVPTVTLARKVSPGLQDLQTRAQRILAERNAEKTKENMWIGRMIAAENINELEALIKSRDSI